MLQLLMGWDRAGTKGLTEHLEAWKEAWAELAGISLVITGEGLQLGLIRSR